MARVADVVVIGGGIVGVCIAHALAERGTRRVVLLEKDALGSGATGRSSALVRMHYANEGEARLAWASFPVFREWTDRMGGPDVFTRTGFLQLVGRPYVDHLHQNVAMLRRLGIDTRVLSPEDVRELQPFARVDDVGAAAYEPESGYASPADTVEGFRRRAEDLGVRILQGTPVVRILRRNSRVHGVATPDGEIGSDVVVVAAGAWAPRLCREAMVALPARVKGIDTVVVIRPPELSTPHMTVIDNILGTYYRPESGVLTIVGVPCQAWDLDLDATATPLPPTAAPEAAQILAHRMPAMEQARLARGFRAFDCYSADRHPILDAVPDIDGLYVATAFSGSGFKIAPAVGTCMAELILDGRARTVDIRPFGLGRFAEGRPLDVPYPYAPRRDHVEPAAGPEVVAATPGDSGNADRSHG